MTESRTRANDASVAAYLAAIPDAARRADCEALVALMRKVTRQPPTIWGSSIVGFGSYPYKCASGREGDACATGFASRKTDISIYLMASGPGQAALLARLGKHRMGKACLSIKRMSDIDSAALERLVAESVTEIRRRHG